jgi:hypothetical protein
MPSAAMRADKPLDQANDARTLFSRLGILKCSRLAGTGFGRLIISGPDNRKDRVSVAVALVQARTAGTLANSAEQAQQVSSCVRFSGSE